MSQRAGVYCRISRDRVGAGLGVDRQRADCVALAERLGATVVDFYLDNDLSAYSGKRRPHYERLLGDVTAGRVDLVLAWHPDRLHRAPVELEHYIDVTGTRGVATHCVQAGVLDLSTASGRMNARIVGAVARGESEHRSERVMSKRESIAESGGFLGGSRPFGYDDDGVTVRTDEAEAIKAATKAILAGSSLRAEAAKLNDAGFRRARSGEPWTPRALGRVLARPRNAGLMVHKGHVVGQASWEPIVDEADWRAVCSLLEDPTRRTTSSNKIKWLGSGLFLCGTCGQGMRVNSSSRHRQQTYRCPGAGDGRRHVTRGAVALDEWAARLVVARLSQPSVRTALARLTAGPEVDFAALHRELDELSVTREELARQQADGMITISQFVTMNTSAREREDAIQRELAAARTGHPAEKLIDSGDVAAAWDALSLDERRSILAATVTITVKQGKAGRPHDGTLDESAIDTEFLI